MIAGPGPYVYKIYTKLDSTKLNVMLVF